MRCHGWGDPLQAVALVPGGSVEYIFSRCRFHELAQRHHETGEPFTAMDYVAPTPHWAVFGSEHRGFDPVETRFHRKSKPEPGC
jgi:hypothetical protein